MQRHSVERHIAGQKPLRLQRQQLSTRKPILSLDISIAESKIQMESRTRVRKLRRELRAMIWERRRAEHTILQKHPLMEYHLDTTRLFYGTDIDQQFSS